MASNKTIQDNLKKTVESINPGIDTTKGPVWDLLLRPVPDEIAAVSSEVAALSTLYSPLIATVPANTASVSVLGQAFKVAKPTGKRARCGLLFWFTSVPTQTITIPAGTAVGTVDKSIVYTTVSDTVGINSQTAYSYYNSSTGRYEVFVDAVASLEGSAYEVPAYRLTLLMSNVPGISGVYNPGPGRGGVDSGTDQSYLSLIQKRFRGRVSTGFDSYSEQILELFPDAVTGFVTSASPWFRRAVRGDGFDVVVAESDPVPAEETFAAVSAVPGTDPNTSVFAFEHRPVLSVNAVYVNGSRTSDYELAKDVDPSTRGSARSNDTLILKQKLKTTDTVRVNFNYCNYCYGLQYQLFNTGTDDFFGSDACTRLAEPAQITVSIDVQLTTNTNGFQNSVVGYVVGYVNGLGFVSGLDYEQFLSDLYSTYTEIKSIRINAFHRNDRYVNLVENLEFTGYETPAIATANVTVTVL